MTDNPEPVVTLIERLDALKAKVTDEALHESGRHFNDRRSTDLMWSDDYDSSLEFCNAADGEAIALLWNAWRSGQIVSAPAPATPLEELIARLTQLACMDRSSDTSVTEQAKEAMLEAAAVIATRRDELDKAPWTTVVLLDLLRNEIERAIAAEATITTLRNELAEARRERDDHSLRRSAILIKSLQLQRSVEAAKANAEAATRTAFEMAIREAAAIAARHRSKLQINEPLWHEGQDWAADRIEQAILALLDSPPAGSNESKGYLNV